MPRRHQTRLLGPHFAPTRLQQRNLLLLDSPCRFVLDTDTQSTPRLRNARHDTLTDSITHSIPANSAPTLPNPFPLRHIPRPISLKISRAFCCVLRFCRSSGSSYANDELMSEKKPPMANPSRRKQYLDVCSMVAWEYTEKVTYLRPPQ